MNPDWLDELTKIEDLRRSGTISDRSHVEWFPHQEEADGIFWRFESAVFFEDMTVRIWPERWRRMAKTHAATWIVPYTRWFDLDDLASRSKTYRDWQMKIYKRERKIIYDHTYKKHAYPTKLEAWHSWLKRFGMRRIHAQTEMDRCNMLAQLVEKEKERLDGNEKVDPPGR